MRRISYSSILFFLLLSACLPKIEDILPVPIHTPSAQAILFVYRFEIPSFVGFSSDFQLRQEIPFSYPVSCGLYDTFPAPSGHSLAIELSCPNGQSVLFLDVETGTITLPFTDTDSHFLAWQSDGLAAYIKADSLSDPKIIRTHLNGTKDVLAIPEFIYDLSAKPDSFDYTFTLSRGLGYGSELYLSNSEGRDFQLLYSDQYNYISFARFSPNGKQIAFIKIPDTQTPFTMGELWVMDADGTNSRKLADADAGHGYAANWSPDGRRIAYVVRENPDDENADRSSEALVSNIYVVAVETGALTQVSYLTEGRAETPHWSPDGNTLAFNVVLNGRMEVHIADIESGEIRSLVTEPACCPAWMRK